MSEPIESLSVTPALNRRVRVFVSSTFRDMAAERDELMTHTWPELRRFCRERQVEFVEVDLRWGIAEEQSKRKETLKLCLDEIHACRPFFIGLLGERYGWTPGEDAFTADLKDEQPWLKEVQGKSVTELEMLHGVLNNLEMAERSFFYFRDPVYANSRGVDFLPENQVSIAKQNVLKETIRRTCAARKIPLHENYPSPQQLAALVLEELKMAIDAQFPKESIPDPLTREARDHDAFAEVRRRTYIGRPDYFDVLNRHVVSDGGPLVLMGDSGSGKSALLANWLEQWHKAHPNDFIFQHYIGSTPDSAEHWRLISRLIAEIKRWTDDPEELPRTHDDIFKTFPVWLAKARIRAERDGVRFIVVLDALNQLDDLDHARTLGWLPEYPFNGPLRFIASTLPGETLDAVIRRRWESLRVEPLAPDERHRMIAQYLARFGKKLDTFRLERLTVAPASANPLYLKILLDELRVTGTHDRLDERLGEYLAVLDIPALLEKVLSRYQRDYERERPGLVGEALGLIWAARRGLTEAELLRLLKPANLPQLPMATWSPLRAALEDSLVDRGGILNFAHDFLRTAVRDAFVPNEHRQDELRMRLADDFEKQPVSARSCDELPWLLSQTKQRDRLRACLLDIDRFLKIRTRDSEELMRYWVELGEERTMGKPYDASFDYWSTQPQRENIAFAANELSLFLDDAALYLEAEPLKRQALAITEKNLGSNHSEVAICLSNLAVLFQATNRFAEAEPLHRRALAITEKNLGPNHPDVAIILNNLGELLREMNRLKEAEGLYQRALAITKKNLGSDHPDIAIRLNNLAVLLHQMNRLVEAEPLKRQALAITEKSLGPNHPDVAGRLINLAELLRETNRLAEAEPLYRRALAITEKGFGPEHPRVATCLSNLAVLLDGANRLVEAEPLHRRALAITEKSLGPNHPDVATRLDNLAVLLRMTNRLLEAEPLQRRALAIYEKSFGPEHPDVAICLNNLALLLRSVNQLPEAELLFRRALTIYEKNLGLEHPNMAQLLDNLALLLIDAHRPAEAEELAQRALKIFLKINLVTGHEPPRLQAAIDILASLLEKKGLNSNQVLTELALVQMEAEESIGDTKSLSKPEDRLPVVSPLLQASEVFTRNEATSDYWKPSGDWFLQGYEGQIGLEIKCPMCSWEGSFWVREERPPSECPRCGCPKKEVKQLLICRYCGQKFNPRNPGPCSHHPQEPELIDHTGPSGDYTDVYRFPCCQQVVVSDNPPRSPGCVEGRHEEKSEASLLTCKHCGQRFDAENPGGCSYHPQEAQSIGETGPRGEWDKYVFPCCGQEYDGYENRLSFSLFPPQSPGCTKHNHEA